MKEEIKGKGEEIRGKLSRNKAEELKGKARQTAGKVQRTGRDIRDDIKDEAGKHREPDDPDSEREAEEVQEKRPR
jgi:uncharacterized protein YjbJ (UPF0337 family)